MPAIAKVKGRKTPGLAIAAKIENKNIYSVLVHAVIDAPIFGEVDQDAGNTRK